MSAGPKGFLWDPILKLFLKPLQGPIEAFAHLSAWLPRRFPVVLVITLLKNLNGEIIGEGTPHARPHCRSVC